MTTRVLVWMKPHKAKSRSSMIWVYTHDRARRAGISQKKWLIILEPQNGSLNVRQTWTIEVILPLKYANTMKQIHTLLDISVG